MGQVCRSVGRRRFNALPLALFPRRFGSELVDHWQALHDRGTKACFVVSLSAVPRPQHSVYIRPFDHPQQPLFSRLSQPYIITLTFKIL